MVRTIVRFLIFFIGLTFNSSISWGITNEPVLPPDLNVGFYYPSIQHQVSRHDFEASVTLWLKEVTRNIKSVPIKVILFDTTDAMRKAFEQGALALIVGPPFTLAKYFNRASLADGLSGTTPDNKPNGLILLARNDKQINSVQDLRGKRIAMPLNNELAEVFLDHLTLTRYRQPFQKVFRAIGYKSQYTALVYEVFFDKADVAVTFKETYDVMIELNPQLLSIVKILKTYPFKAPNYGFFHKSYPADLRKLWIERAIQLENSPRAKQVLINLKMGGFEYCPVEELAPFDRLAEAYAKQKRSEK